MPPHTASAASASAPAANLRVMGDDWRGRFDHLREFCEVVCLSRTPSVSTTAVIEKIRR